MTCPNDAGAALVDGGGAIVNGEILETGCSWDMVPVGSKLAEDGLGKLESCVFRPTAPPEELHDEVFDGWSGEKEEPCCLGAG